MDLMNRYQGAIDNELYRAMDALRKQQDWRQKNGIDLEAEVEVAYFYLFKLMISTRERWHGQRRLAQVGR